MSDRATPRAEILHSLSDALAHDPRVSGVVLAGSGATGFRDDESDIDIVAPVASTYDAAMMFQEWKARIGEVVDVHYHAETALHSTTSRWCCARMGLK